MLRIILFLAFVCSFVHGFSRVQRIVNGSDSKPGEYPYAISLRYYNKHECGGSIIGHKWVLTATHCVYKDSVNKSSILFGSISLQQGERPVRNSRNVVRAITNENYVPSGGYFNDVALLELDEPIEFNKYVQPVPLPEQDEATATGSIGVLVGWGYSRDEGDVMPILQNVKLEVYSDEECAEAHPGLINSNAHLCVGVREGGKGQCAGDSGGPFTVAGIQQGIVSWSDRPCSLKGHPGVLTKVSSYRNWIREKTGI